MNGPEVEQLRQAVGLATTAKPSMVMRPDDPIGMMQEIVAQTAALLAEIEQLRTERDALLAVARTAKLYLPDVQRLLEEIAKRAAGEP